ncbi:MAG TPA: RNA polymerase sigma factor [Virgibacillus sp.]|nr:RNA polymerase sigma factor [Virgibacillus sp.]
MPDKAMHQEQIINWYDDYSMPIFKYILKMLKDAEQAEDLTQDTFIKAYKYLMKDKDVTYPKTFLYRIAHNLTIDYIRKKAPIRMMADFFTQQKDAGPSIESIIEIKETSQELYDVLSNLKSTYRSAIILRKIDGFSVKETAHILQWSESKVKSTLSRGLQALEKELDKGGVIHET